MSRVLATCGTRNDGQQPVRIAALLEGGLWDLISMEDRREFTENGVVLDSPGGRLIFELLKWALG